MEGLAYDYARCERVVARRIPAFFDTGLSVTEQDWVKQKVQEKTGEIRGQGIKLQHFAAVFTSLPVAGQRSVCLFCYLTAAGQKMRVAEDCLTLASNLRGEGDG